MYIYIYIFIFFSRRKKKKKMLFPYFCQLRRLVFDQSSPLHPVSESRGGTLSVTDGAQTEILVSNIG